MNRSEAKKQFERLKNNCEKILVIHYSCESFYDKQGLSPRTVSVSLLNYATGQIKSFSIHEVANIKGFEHAEINVKFDLLEKALLDSYYTFLEQHKGWYFVHWRMIDSSFGFEALNHRYLVLGGKPTQLDASNLFNLSALLKAYYGDQFIDKPRLERLIEKNALGKRDFLTGQEEADAFKKGQYYEMYKSTLKKVKNIGELLSLHLDRKLKTNEGKIAMITRMLQESWRFWVILTVIALVSGIIQIGQVLGQWVRPPSG